MWNCSLLLKSLDGLVEYEPRGVKHDVIHRKFVNLEGIDVFGCRVGRRSITEEDV